MEKPKQKEEGLGGGFAAVVVLAVDRCEKKQQRRWHLFLLTLSFAFLFYLVAFSSSSFPPPASLSSFALLLRASSSRLFTFLFGPPASSSLPVFEATQNHSEHSPLHKNLSSLQSQQFAASSAAASSPLPSPRSAAATLQSSPRGDTLPVPNRNPLPCDISKGKWRRDDSYPLYPPSSCRYIDESFNCFSNGRSDLNYTRWKWQPDSCHIPRFNAVDMLERLKGKRMVFVGDSLNRNQYESMVCLLRQAISNNTDVYEIHGDKITRGTGSSVVVFKKYGFRLEFYRTNFLVMESQMRGKDGKTRETLKLDTIDRLAVKWSNADVLVFNTGHWWTHWKTDEGRDYFQEGSEVHPSMKLSEAFKKAVKTWATWVDTHVNASETQVFFRSYSPSHFSGGQWNSGGQCDDESMPIFNSSYLNPYPDKMRVVEEAMRAMKVPAKVLNVTRLSDFRKDAHPSLYGHRQKQKKENPEQGPLAFQDCSHWCLPGLPDTWNEILYAHIAHPNYYM